MGRAPLLALATALLVGMPLGAVAQDFSTTNLQASAGVGFHDSLSGWDTPDGVVATLTINHFSSWALGDNLAFVDLGRGDFRDGATSKLYAEWHPRLSLSKILGQRRPFAGVFRDFFVVAEVNQAEAFYAYLAGVGCDFEVGDTAFLGLSLYFRYDRFVGRTWQVSPFWLFPFALGRVPVVLTGFADFSGTANNTALDVVGQPQLLVDVLAPFDGPPNRLLIGVEWFLRYNPGIEPRPLVSAPQALVNWTWH